jgi:cell division protein FtsL
MGRFIPPILIILMIAGAVMTYDTKHKAEKAAEHVRTLRTEIDAEKAAMRMLRAEWSVLTQPSRLQALAEKYKDELGLETANTGQFVTLEDVPARAVAPGLPDDLFTSGVAR